MEYKNHCSGQDREGIFLVVPFSRVLSKYTEVNAIDKNPAVKVTEVAANDKLPAAIAKEVEANTTAPVANAKDVEANDKTPVANDTEPLSNDTTVKMDFSWLFLFSASAVTISVPGENSCHQGAKTPSFFSSRSFAFLAAILMAGLFLPLFVRGGTSFPGDFCKN